MSERPETHLRVLSPDDAQWMVALDRAGYPGLPRFGWHVEKLAAELEEGIWASSLQVGWAVIVDGEPAGVAFARRLDGDNGVLDIRLFEGIRGRGVGREVLRQLADHHFSEHEHLRRLEGRTHEHNVPMQRAFNAAGFRMEARYRDAIEVEDGGFASEWGYALTRQDWEEGLHRADDSGYDLHGLTFRLESSLDEPEAMVEGSLAKFLTEGRRVLVRYSGGKVTDGEAAGILYGDQFRYQFIHVFRDHEIITGWGRARVQRRGDDRLELVDEWNQDGGRIGRHVWVERQG